MTAAVHVAGACEIKIATADQSLVTLGWSRNMADVRKEAFFLDVPGDQNGGDDGPPIDIIYLGEIAVIRLELTKWDYTVVDVIRARLSGGTAGSTGTPGTLIAGAATPNWFRVLLSPTATAYARNFPTCVPRGAIEVGRGTKFSTLVCEFEAHSVAGILYDSVGV